ncbi:MAG: sulfide/dihydroorotate dehydrogenase-like FAD/NAD-binding protein [Lentisphaeria bacterium]
MPKNNEVLFKEQLSENVFLIRIYAPNIAESRHPGQFLILSVDETYGERIPLTIADVDQNEKSITVIFQTVGYTTKELAKLEPGQTLAVVLGPLGKPTNIQKVGRVVCVGGGIGVAPMHPIAKAMKEAGNHVTCIIGARNKQLVILEKQLNAFADHVIVCTDDGTAGRKALVTQPLKEICEQEHPDLVIAIGPPIMMKFCVETVRPFKDTKVVVSLNTIMVDGTGMCGGCRVQIGDETKFVCVDGPEFDGRLVDFDGMMKRLGAYKTQEHEFDESHHCTCMQK